MSILVIPFTFSAGAVIIASQHNSCLSTIYSDYNGNIDNNNIVAAAGIAYSKLTLTGGIVNADLSASAAIANTKINLASITGTINIGTAHQGDVYYDNGTTITRLTPGTSGQFLQTQGAAANPQWAGAVSSQVFISSGTFTAPTGVTRVSISMVGAGGGGGGGNSGVAGGGGGGSGAYVIGYPYTVVAGNSYTVTLNAGGTGQDSADGSNGGSSVFDSLTVLGGSGGVSGTGSANGGAGGVASSNINSTATVSTVGSTAGGMVIIQVGGNGGKGNSSTDGGGGGGSPFGLGGDASVPTAPIANSGGGGSGRSKSGGKSATDGARGICIVQY